MTFSGAVPGPDGQPLDQIRLTGVTATGHHGVLAHERAEGQVFRADVVLHLDTRAAARGDDLAATVSYADVAEDVHDVLAGRPADLVETVAERIAAAALAYPAVHAVDVRVHKPQAPIAVPFDDVEVAIRRDRVRTPVVPAEAPAGEPEQAAQVEPEAPTAPEQAEADSHEPAAERAPVTAVPAPPAPPAPPVTGVPAFDPEPLGVVPAPPEEPEPVRDPLDVAPDEPVEVVIALGANLGEAQATLRQAVTDIDRIAGLQVMEVSPLARTAAVGGPEQPDFLNAVLLARTTLSPREVLHACQRVEEQHGRVREERWGPRTLDVDIVQYGTLVATADDLELPHPRARERAFVLVPWAEVAPDAVLHGLGGGPVAQLAATAPDRSGIRWLALDWLADPQDTVAPAPPAPPAPGTGPVPSSAPLPERPTSGAHAVPPQTVPPQQPVPPQAVPPQQALPPQAAVPPQQAPAQPVHEPIPPAPDSPFAPRPEQYAPATDRAYAAPSDTAPSDTAYLPPTDRAFAPPSYHPPHADDRDR
ncbi:2-amino-4-hydroxy-6-hydroxymethyldihydropteridine diphosphokinase [Isoptericola variabilis]|uniref:Bifunctional folate synthesis protein n=1 Tax=Isoptericola variabilis (strain 225) TaxID=743718 RepID=F6FTY5_ISOV2|nr:2-amino-4-hydroxy-6-hydroxymethyldihydropteridine diphosphokinase [Isoptericola variabilis]AEG45356.1 2-amino-4-hydroxy-6-hydroxymethyldihydropteridine pyrophosphokinase [Isoptericola variabilis 225]TWH34859.1 dihydroneopterin aldolase/2-amino-4-hydroxy-6-hydroxymethyldihydropteridine diphosphokinase [Isoptericola variabilis J7]